MAVGINIKPSCDWSKRVRGREGGGNIEPIRSCERRVTEQATNEREGNISRGAGLVCVCIYDGRVDVRQRWQLELISNRSSNFSTVLSINYSDFNTIKSIMCFDFD